MSGTPCRLVGPGHEAQPITHWRSMPMSERHEIDELEQVGPDTLRLVLGPLLTHVRVPGLWSGPVELRFCTHDVDRVLDVWRRRGAGTSIRFHGRGLALEWSEEDHVLRRSSLAEPYRYVPCADVTADPRDASRVLAIPRIPELDQLVRAGLQPAEPVRSPPVTQDEIDAAWERAETEEDADGLIDGIEAELADELDEDEEGDEMDESEDGEEVLVGEVVAKLRIGPSGWFDGARSELLAVGPGRFGSVQRWDPFEPGEAVTWPVALRDRTAAALRWAIDELDRILDGFPGGRHLLRLIADGTVEDRFELRHAGVDGEEAFRVRLVLTSAVAVDATATRAAAAVLAGGAVGWTHDGLRADGVWTLVVPGRREPRRARVVVALEREDHAGPGE